MRFGRFDDVNKEYVIERPDTPATWSNYLGSTEYGAIITNNAGGYSFFHSSFDGRFLRLRSNSVPLDQPGRYFYLRDNGDGDYWSASWQPVGKPLGEFKSICRHGTAYTIIESEYKGIRSEASYFVPLNQNFEYWLLKVTNTSDKKRDLSLFTYAEFSSHWTLTQDLLNLQYSQYIVKTDMEDNVLQISSSYNLGNTPKNSVGGTHGNFCWMTMRGTEITSFDSLREAFLGSPHRGYHNPLVVETGKGTGSLAHGDNACGSLQSRITLEPGESREIVVMLGVRQVDEEIRQCIDTYGNWDSALKELDVLKEYWHSRLGNFIVDSPDKDLDHMVNVWNAYNCLITYAWSRSASLLYNGERNGLGFRDTVQDILGVLPLIPDTAVDRLRLMLTGQLSHGGAMPVVKPYSHKPGFEAPTPEEELRSDDCLWFFNTIPAYVAETGDVGFYTESLPYADKGEGTVFRHLKQALLFNLERTGANGLPSGLHADWNDCLKLGYRGESLFVTFQLRYGLVVYKDIAIYLGESEEASWADSELKKLDKKIQDTAWDGKWFIRAINEEGVVRGTDKADEGKIFLNTQSWSVLSGAATSEQAAKAMESVNEHLNTDYGLMICAPPYQKASVEEVKAVLFNDGQKENAGIFCHPQGWAVMAECMLGHGDRAYRYYRNYMPSAYNDKAEIRGAEPYVHAQSTHSIYSRLYGSTRLPWLSGTASWSYFSAIQYILGIRPAIDGLVIDPCIPSTWEGFKVSRRFRGKRINITVKNPGKKCMGVKRITAGKTTIEGNKLPVDMLKEGLEVTVVLE